jgi:type IV pilus assembly protein PilX
VTTALVRRGAASRERGVVLFVALIVLVVMTLAGLALMRQMSSGTSIAGNVAFKESATSVADLGIEKGIAWILANQHLLDTDDTAAGYYSSWTPNVDPTTFDWSVGVTGAASEAAAMTGNDARYIIHRLCETPNLGALAPGQYCSDSFVTTIKGASHEACSYGTCLPTPVPGPFYRITSRVIGPRNAVSFTQVLIN